MPAPPTSIPRPHYPALDGLRGVAVLSVCLTHYCTLAWPEHHDLFFWGFSTVDLFFVLSGFLITGILYDTRPAPHFFRNFYIRRALRILPVFLFAWGVLLLAAVFLHPVWNLYHFTFLVYLGNFFMPGGRAGYHTEISYFYYVAASGHRFYATIGHLWTLCQEEQFYLVWPFFLWLIPSRRTLIALCLAGAVAILGLRVFLYFHADPRMLGGDLLYFSPFTRFDAHLIGGALALFLRGERGSRAGALPRMALFVTPIALLVSLEVAFGSRWPLNLHHPLVSTYGFTLDCIASTGLLLLCLDPRTLAARLLSHPALLQLGRVSYAFYLFHYLPFQFFANQWPRLAAHHLLLLIPTVSLLLSYLAALLSYRFLERPFLRMKSTLAPDPKLAPASR